MAKQRKKSTFDVQKFKDYVNEQLARTDDFAVLTEGFKSGMCTALERVLFDTGNYQGYQNLYWQEIGYNAWVEAGKPEEWDLKKKFIVGLINTKYGGSDYARKYY